MIFYLTAVNLQGENQSFAFTNSALETGFDVLNTICSMGHILLEAAVCDGENSLRLPVEAFDGQPCLPTILSLEQEWQAVLKRPIQVKSSYHQRAVDLMANRIKRHENCIAKLEMAISRTQYQLANVQTINSRESYRNRAINQLELTLNRFQASLVAERLSLERLAKLQP